MNLKILREYKRDFDENNMVLKADMLKEKGTHLFIASNKWETIYVELHEGLEPWYLHFLPGCSNNIQVIGQEDTLNAYMQVLIELYPDKSGAIRRAVMQKQSILSVIGAESICKQ